MTNFFSKAPIQFSCCYLRLCIHDICFMWLVGFCWKNFLSSMYFFQVAYSYWMAECAEALQVCSGWLSYWDVSTNLLFVQILFSAVERTVFFVALFGCVVILNSHSKMLHVLHGNSRIWYSKKPKGIIQTNPNFLICNFIYQIYFFSNQQWPKS